MKQPGQCKPAVTLILLPAQQKPDVNQPTAHTIDGLAICSAEHLTCTFKNQGSKRAAIYQ